MTKSPASFVSMLCHHLNLAPESSQALTEAFTRSVYESSIHPTNESLLQGWGVIEEILERPIQGNPTTGRWFVRVSLFCGAEALDDPSAERAQEMDLFVSERIEQTIKTLNEVAGAQPFGDRRVFLTIRNPYSSAYSGRKSVFTDSRGILEAIHIA